jgi:hypothetical protein
MNFFRSFGLSPQDDRIKIYIFILRLLPLIQFVGITGASAMWGLRENDDVDLFIITRHGFLWTTRFVVILLAKMLGIHGRRGACLNLFFDESDLAIPKKKQNSYIAHEILQMKPVIDIGEIHRSLISQNAWIASYYPNSRRKNLEERIKTDSFCLLSSFFCLLEPLARLIQLPIILRNKTSLLITPTQLWLFKKDFEKKLKRKGLVL